MSDIQDAVASSSLAPSSARQVVDGLLDAIVAGDDAQSARLADLGADDLSSLRIRHSTAGTGMRLEPEFTIVDGARVTTAVWLPVPVPEGVLDLYSFDSFVVVAGRVVGHVSSAVPFLDYQHLRTQTAPRRPLPQGADQEGAPADRAELVAGFNRDVFAAGDPDAVDRFVTDDYRQHAEWRGPSGRAALKRIVQGIVANPAPPGRPAPAPLFETVQGALVVAAAAMGPLVGFDAYLVKDGLLAEHWSGIDPRWRP